MRIEATDLTPLEQRLVDEAVKIRPRAYAVYSNYLVGAAVADADGGIHVGANMEGADYTLTVHAEQHAMNAMRLATNAKAVALAFAVQSPSESPSPCGVCRQRIREFAGSLQMPIVAVSLDKDLKIERLNRYPFDFLLPNSFGPENLGKELASLALRRADDLRRFRRRRRRLLSVLRGRDDRPRPQRRRARTADCSNGTRLERCRTGLGTPC